MPQWWQEILIHLHKVFQVRSHMGIQGLWLLILRSFLRFFRVPGGFRLCTPISTPLWIYSPLRFSDLPPSLFSARPPKWMVSSGLFSPFLFSCGSSAAMRQDWRLFKRGFPFTWFAWRTHLEAGQRFNWLPCGYFCRLEPDISRRLIASLAAAMAPVAFSLGFCRTVARDVPCRYQGCHWKCRGPFKVQSYTDIFATQSFIPKKTRRCYNICTLRW
jgi:hypothetical protein